ncbi:DUF4249 domain-containing protein [Bacteroides sp. OttesenSCG-928-J23]|nr:DUF4249 domain-containing protein [Bacteroides sp. OttesenSCG-928-J23]MDL2305836.1 DUF4249 domain-containing protein [Bacteroides sp. OttesenSCG-928-D19]
MKLSSAFGGLIVSIASLFVGCTTDYDVGNMHYGKGECMGVNAVLSPQNPIRINLFQVRMKDDTYSSSGLMGAHILLEEDGRVIYEGVSADSILVLPEKPQVGRLYSIKVSYAGLKSVTAYTTIPEAIACDVSMEIVENSWSTKDYLVKLDAFEVSRQSKASLWVTAHEENADGEMFGFWQLYCNSSLLDRENAEIGVGSMQNKWVGAVYYELFLRIKNKNIAQVNEILFTPYTYGYQKDAKLVIQLVSANSEYDQYCKTLYRQQLIKSYDDALSMMFFQPEEVYGNVENGLGIFAGVNQQSYYFDGLY